MFRNLVRIARHGFLAASLALASGAASAAEIALPAFSRSLAYHPETGVVVAPMTLQGVAFVDISGEAPTLIGHLPDVPTMAAVPVPGGGFLLAGRFSKLEYVERNQQGAFAVVDSWTVEGIPTDLHLDGTRLLVAGGGAGVGLFEWANSRAVPALRGRFPHVDYSKQMAFGAGGVMLLADNRDTGMQLLDVQDLQRPRLLSITHDGFVDSVAAWGNLAVLASRNVGARIYDISTPGKPTLLSTIDLMPSPDPRGPVVKRVAADGGGRLLVCEGLAGARVFQLNAATPPQLLVRLPGTAGDGMFLPNGQVLLSRESGAIAVVEVK